MEDLISDLSAPKLESSVQNWTGLLEKKQPKKKGVRHNAPVSGV